MNATQGSVSALAFPKANERPDLERMFNRRKEKIRNQGVRGAGRRREQRFTQVSEKAQEYVAAIC